MENSEEEITIKIRSSDSSNISIKVKKTQKIQELKTMISKVLC